MPFSYTTFALGTGIDQSFDTLIYGGTQPPGHSGSMPHAVPYLF